MGSLNRNAGKASSQDNPGPFLGSQGEGHLTSLSSATCPGPTVPEPLSRVILKTFVPGTELDASVVLSWGAGSWGSRLRAGHAGTWL